MSKEAIIRSYTHTEDENKLARFTAAKACMEPLAYANYKCTCLVSSCQTTNSVLVQRRRTLS